jgi:hypothetical protein
VIPMQLLGLGANVRAARARPHRATGNRACRETQNATRAHARAPPRLSRMPSVRASPGGGLPSGGQALGRARRGEELARALGGPRRVRAALAPGQRATPSPGDGSHVASTPPALVRGGTAVAHLALAILFGRGRNVPDLAPAAGGSPRLITDETLQNPIQLSIKVPFDETRL